MQRSIWVKGEDWVDMKDRARLFGRSVSNYLVMLHKAKVSHKEDSVSLEDAYLKIHSCLDFSSESAKNEALAKSVDNIKIQDPTKAGFFNSQPKQGVKKVKEKLKIEVPGVQDWRSEIPSRPKGRDGVSGGKKE